MRIHPLSALSLLALAALARAGDTRTYRYTQDISSLAISTPLVGAANRVMHLGLQLTDGTQLGNSTTTITLGNFTILGGEFLTPLSDIGGVTRVNGNVVLRDDATSIGGLADHTVPFNVFSTNGSATLSFDFTIVTTAIDAPDRDYFNVSLLTDDLVPVATDGDVGSEQLGVLVTGDVVPRVFSVDPAYAAMKTADGDPRFTLLKNPVVALAPVPEPASLVVLGLGLTALKRRRVKA